MTSFVADISPADVPFFLEKKIICHFQITPSCHFGRIGVSRTHFFCLMYRIASQGFVFLIATLFKWFLWSLYLGVPGHLVAEAERRAPMEALWRARRRVHTPVTLARDQPPCSTSHVSCTPWTCTQQSSGVSPPPGYRQQDKDS